MATANLRQHKLGWIGIGRMGYAMVERLAKAGCDISVWNRTRAKAEPLKAHGAKIVDSLTDLAACDIVFTMVAAGDDVKEVLYGANGVLSKGKAPQIVVDSTSISIEASSEIRAELAKRGVKFLSAPVSGNAKVIKSGKLVVCASGPQDAYDAVAPYLAAIFTRYKSPALVNLDFHVTFTPHLLRKDLDLGLDAGRELDVPLPLASITRDLVQTLIGNGYADQDFSTLLLRQAKASGIELKPENVHVDDGLSS